MANPFIMAGQPESTVRSQDAYEQMLPQIRAVPDDVLVHINRDVTQVVTTILGSLPEMRTLRPRMIAELPTFDVNELDGLEIKTRALSVCHAIYVAASNPSVPLEQLVENCTSSRETLHVEAQVLVHRGLLEPTVLAAVKRSTAHRALALDCQALAMPLLKLLPTLEGKTSLKREEVERALFNADRLNDALGFREHGPVTVTEATTDRQRAYTLVVKAYAATRRTVTFLCGEDEATAERIAPSLHAGRNQLKRPDGKKPEDEKQEPGQLATTPRNAPEAAPSAPSTSVPVPIGFPGSSPFIR